MTPLDVAALRRDEFAWMDEDDGVYLNCASTGPLPARTIEAVARFTAERARPHRISDERQFGILERSRELCARAIGASPREIAVAINTSFGLNIAARCLPLKWGDVVVTFDGEFPANVYPWMALDGNGVRLERMPTTAALPDEDALMAALSRPEVRVVAISWVQFATGYRVDLERIGLACRERGIYLVVDAIQGLGAASVDVTRCGIDVFACGAQKWLLGPWGAGFVYVREALARTLEPHLVSWMAVEGSDDFTRLTDYALTWRDSARRFEQVTLPYQEFAGMNASLELLEELGRDEVEAHVAALGQRIVDWATGRNDIALVTPADPGKRAGIVSLAPRDHRRAAERLERARVACSLREGIIRLSPHCYNTVEEIDQALEILGSGSG